MIYAVACIVPGRFANTLPSPGISRTLPRRLPLMARKWWTLTAVSVGIFMLLLDVTIVNVALPDIQHELDASLSDLQWVIDAYALTLAALLRGGGSVDGRVRGGRVRPAGADARPLAAAQADVRRRARGRVRDLGVAVLGAHLPRPVLPERARVLGRRHRRAVPRAHRRDLPHGRGRGAPDLARAGAVADRPRLPAARRRAAADARSPPGFRMDEHADGSDRRLR